MPKKIVIGIILIFFAITAYVYFNQKFYSYVEIKGYKFFVELADTQFKQTQGYSNHQPIKDNEGMLFVFSNNTERSFWMKDMLFPLDMIWISDNKIINISRNLPPEGETPINKYYSGQPSNYVLEINGGLSDKLGLKIGDKVKINLTR